MPDKTSIELDVAKRQAQLLADALEKAKDSKGYWLNKAGRPQPTFYNKKAIVSPFNALLLGLHADRQESKTAQYVLFSESKKNGYPVKGKENGVPFNWARFENYVHRYKPDFVITRDEYLRLDDSAKELYKAQPQKEARVAFNLSQTTFPNTHKQEYAKEVAENGGLADRPEDKNADRDMHLKVNDYILNLRDNLCPIIKSGTDMSFYDSQKDSVVLASHEQYDTYEDYVQDLMRTTISATGNPQRLGRESMVSPDAGKMEKLVEEVASAIKMQELGLPAKLSKEGIGLADYWVRELRENPTMVNNLEADVNSSVAMVNKAARGEKVELGTERIRKEADQGKVLHYAIADTLRELPDKESKIMVVVLNGTQQNADVILPAGASKDESNEIPGMSKKRIEAALKKEGVQSVNFYNVDGALGYHHDDSFYRDKNISTRRLNNWALERLTTLDVTDVVKDADKRHVENVQISKEADGKWMMYIKPEKEEGFGVYADSKDLQLFFAAVKQGDKNTIAQIKDSLADKYIGLVEKHPDLRNSYAGNIEKDADPEKILKSNIYKDKEGNLKLYVQVEGLEDKKLLPRPVTQQQFQRMFLAANQTDFKKKLAAVIFPDILRGENIEASIDTKHSAKRSTVSDSQIHVTEKMTENWLRNAPSKAEVPDLFSNILVAKDDEGKWVGYVKPEGKEGRSVYPQREDLAVFFDSMKNSNVNMEDVRQAFARRVYVMFDRDPKSRTDLFKSMATENQLAMIDKANIYKTQPDEKHAESQLLCIATIQGERQKPKPVTTDQWQRMWNAPDMQQFKKNLAGTLYLDVLKEKEAIVQEIESHQEDIECTKLLEGIDGIKQQLKTETDPHKQFDLREQIKLMETQLANRVEMLKSGAKEMDKEPVHAIPLWAVDYIMKGDSSKLTKEQMQVVDDFLDKHFNDGYVPEVQYGSEKDNNANPAFSVKGEKVATIDIKFGAGAYFESRNEGEKSKPEQETEVVVDNTKEIEKQKQQEAKADKQLSPMLKQFLDLKAKHPDALLLFRAGDFYETYMQDAEKASQVLGITLTKSSRQKDPEGKPLAMAGFPYHALDTYLPKLIRNGCRVAICDQIEAPRQKPSQEKPIEALQSHQGQKEEKSHGFHR